MSRAWGTPLSHTHRALEKPLSPSLQAGGDGPRSEIWLQLGQTPAPEATPAQRCLAEPPSLGLGCWLPQLEQLEPSSAPVPLGWCPRETLFQSPILSDGLRAGLLMQIGAKSL